MDLGPEVGPRVDLPRLPGVLAGLGLPRGRDREAVLLQRRWGDQGVGPGHWEVQADVRHDGKEGEGSRGTKKKGEGRLM